MRYPYPWRAFCMFLWGVLIMIDDHPALELWTLLQPAQQICAMIRNLDVNINVNPPTYFKNLHVNIYKTKQ